MSDDKEKVEAFIKRVRLWSEESTYKSNHSVHVDVNYYWGVHTGMVQMARECKEIFDILEE